MSFLLCRAGIVLLFQCFHSHFKLHRTFRNNWTVETLLYSVKVAKLAFYNCL